MKKCLAVVAAAVAALVLGCASGQKSVVLTESSMPDWINEVPPEDMVYGIGFADNAQVSLRMTMAEQRARVNIAQQLSSRVQSMVSDYSREAGGIDNTAALQFQEAVSRQLAQADLSGAVLDKRETTRDGKGIWVRVKMSRNQAAEEAKKAYNSEAARYAEFKNDEAQALMSTELDKAFGAPTPTVR